MSNTNMVCVRTQEEFQHAVEHELQGTLVVLNACGTFVIPTVQRATPFPKVIVMGGATLIGGHCPLHIAAIGSGSVSVEDVASVKTATSGDIDVIDAPTVTILHAGRAVVRNCETVVAYKGISIAAYDCGQVIIEGKTDESDA